MLDKARKPWRSRPFGAEYSVLVDRYQVELHTAVVIILRISVGVHPPEHAVGTAFIPSFVVEASKSEGLVERINPWLTADDDDISPPYSVSCAIVESGSIIRIDKPKTK